MVDIIVDAHILLVGMIAVQAPGVLLQGAAPGYGHGQQQGSEAGIIESFADIPSRGQQQARLIGWNRLQLVFRPCSAGGVAK